MKKLLLVLAVAILMVCAFAITVCAAETIGGITYSFDGSTAYVTNANKSCALETVIIPETVTDSNGKTYTVKEIKQEAFLDNTTIKYVSIPATITKIYASAFRGCKGLVFVEFKNDPSKNTTLTTADWGVFKDCTALKAVSLPDRMTVIPDRCFNGCTALTAVYLPANLYQIKGNQGNNQAAFYNSPNLYFVQNPFEVRDAFGNFYTAETFNMPARPNVYFFPETLKLLSGTHNPNSKITLGEDGTISGLYADGNIIEGGNDDVGINKCVGLNPVLVLPVGFTGYDEASDKCNPNQTGDMLTRGLIQNCGTKDNPLTLVFLGRVDRIGFDRKDGCTQYMTYVFANEANTGFEDTMVGTFKSKAEYSNQKETYVVFCHANNGFGAKYQITFAGAEDDATTPVRNAVLQEGAVCHLADPNATPYNKEPTCVLDRLTDVIDCFCGNVYSYGSSEPGTALGHDYDVMNGAVDFGIVYDSYLAQGLHKIDCARCNAVDEIVTDALFVWKGYSACTFGEGFSVTQGYLVNHEAIEAYSVYATDFDFGIIATVNTTGGGIAPKLGDENVLTGTFVKNANDYLDIKLTGIPADKGDALVVFCVYVTVGEDMFYLDGDKCANTVIGVSYNQIAG